MIGIVSNCAATVVEKLSVNKLPTEAVDAFSIAGLSIPINGIKIIIPKVAITDN